jgi:predicted aldo/keto reductase-like oxidoreductase
VLNNESVHTAIPGFTNFDHINDDYLVALDLNYTDEEKKLLGDNEVRLGFGFCRQCRQCLVSCPHDADIPTLMRTHMYASQYSDFYLARTTLEEIPQAKSISACADCSNCVARCAHQSVDIAARVADLKLMYA